MQNKQAEKYTQISTIFKALSDPHRLMIIDMLSCGELCACKILERFQITQPTLSHHMKILSQAGLVDARPEGKWMHYSLNKEAFRELEATFHKIYTDNEDCICKEDCLC